MVIFRQQKNFGPNVIYFVVRTSVGSTPGPKEMIFEWFMSVNVGPPRVLPHPPPIFRVEFGAVGAAPRGYLRYDYILFGWIWLA